MARQTPVGPNSRHTPPPPWPTEPEPEPEAVWLGAGVGDETGTGVGDAVGDGLGRTRRGLGEGDGDAERAGDGLAPGGGTTAPGRPGDGRRDRPGRTRWPLGTRGRKPR